MSFKLNPIDVVSTISKDDFQRNYVNLRKPVLLKNYTESWPAFTKWTPEYLKSICGDKVVPLYDNAKADPSKPINAAAQEMKFGDYIDLLCNVPTELRIFFFEIFKEAPQLLSDYQSPTDLMDGFLDKYPSMFFGGKGSRVFLHYDIDLPHIFQAQFHGKKRILLFDQKWSKRLYRLPFSTYALEDYDVANPDEGRFPALRGVEGIECFAEHGDLLYIPSGVWHYMEYLEGGFAISLRAWDSSIATKAHGLYNLIVMRNVDSWLKMKFKTKYMDLKERLAVRIAERAS